MSKLLPTAYVVSNSNLLSSELVLELEKKSCKVIKINSSEDFKKYFESPNEIPEYLFLIQGFSLKDPFLTNAQVKLVLNFSETYLPKTEVVLPYVVDEKSRKEIDWTASEAKKIKNRNLGIVYLGQVYGVGVELAGNWMAQVFNTIFHTDGIRIPKYDFDFYSISSDVASKNLIKGIFSYGFGKKEVVITSQIKASNFLNRIERVLPSTTFFPDEKPVSQATVSNFDFIKVDFDEVNLEKTVKWLVAHRRKTTSIVNHEIKKPESIKVKKIFQRPRIKKIKPVSIFILIFLWICALPFISLFFASATLKAGYTKLSDFDLKQANVYFNVSHGLANFSQVSFSFFETPRKISSIVNNFSLVGEKTVNTLSQGEKIGNSVMAGNNFDLENSSNQLFLDTDDLYKQTSFLIADIKAEPFVKTFLSSIDLDRVSSLIFNVRIIAKELPSFLGQKGDKSYLVLTQDTNELRPTGGVINSFGFLNFNQGKLTETTFSDVNQIDDQASGQVSPPNALQKYLGITNWNLKNSNWDADYLQSAQKAEWFLETGTGENPDGVITLSQDLYERIAGFHGGFLEVMDQILQNFYTKDIQIFLNDNKFEEAFDNLNFNGGVNPPVCFDNCQVDWAGVVEANLGENKVNTNISRTVDVITDLVNDKVQNRVEINYTNSSSTESYRNYVRLMSANDSEFDKVSETVNSVTQTLTPDLTQVSGRVEAGVLIQIPANSKAKLVFTWTNTKTIDYEKAGKILFYLRKQPGIVEIPTTIRFVLPSTLTQGVISSYNTNLTTDFNKEFSW